MRPEASHTAATVDLHREPERRSTKTRSALSARQKVLVGLEAFISLCGLGGGIYLATHPLTAMPVRYLDGTWFDTWRWPGAALVFFVGICPIVVIAAALQGRRLAAAGHVCVGLGLLTWIVLEAAWIVVSPGMQIAVATIGVVIFVLGIGELLATSHTSQLGDHR